MKRLNALATLLLLPLFLSAQWMEKEVGNNIYVQFPSNPEYKISKGVPGAYSYMASYTAKTENCLFMVLILNDVMPNYPEFMRLSKDRQQLAENKLLDGFMEGKLSITDNTPNNNKHIKLGVYNGRECSYSAIMPATGERCKRFSKVFLIKNKSFQFECWFLKNAPDDAASKEKDIFFNSLKYKR